MITKAPGVVLVFLLSLILRDGLKVRKRPGEYTI
jgi:hypothetical protein